jgi:nucleoid DNA-binding protein
MAKVKKEPMSGTSVIKYIAHNAGLKNSIIKNVFIDLSELIAHQLNTAGEIKIPYIAKIAKKTRPARKKAAGNYPNFFKKTKDPKTGEMVPTMEYKPARVIPAKTKLKLYVLKNLKEKLK